MMERRPSLYQLFRRSRYNAAAHAEDSIAMRQTERFAVAAVGFCLEHSVSFRRFFWMRVCGGEPDEAAHLNIEVEPVDWADLRLSTGANSTGTICVVECKIGAPLEAHQDPTCPEFTHDDGYGWFLRRFRRDEPCCRRYVVLGAGGDNGTAGTTAGIGVAWRGWASLLEFPDNDRLVLDLFDSLGKLGVTAFRMKEIKKTLTREPFGQAAQAWEVLTAIAEDFSQVRSRILTNQPSADHFNMGIFLRTPAAKRGRVALLSRLARQLKSPVPQIVWLGYETGPAVGGCRRSIWLYCESDRLAQELLARLKPEYVDAHLDSDGPTPCVVVPSGTSLRADFDWFIETLDAAAKLSAKKL